MLRAFLVPLFLSALPVQAATFNFCWEGGSGHTMTGRMQIADDRMTQAVVTEADVIRFKITGYHNGKRLGSWDMTQRDPAATWHLRFDPRSMTFLTGGSFDGPHSQGWNADGNVSNCGAGGFGFNSGNYAQDICVDGLYVTTSSIAPETPLLATTAPVSPDCSTTQLFSKSRRGESGS